MSNIAAARPSDRQRFLARLWDKQCFCFLWKCNQMVSLSHLILMQHLEVQFPLYEIRACEPADLDPVPISSPTVSVQYSIESHTHVRHVPHAIALYRTTDEPNHTRNCWRTDDWLLTVIVVNIIFEIINSDSDVLSWIRNEINTSLMDKMSCASATFAWKAWQTLTRCFCVCSFARSSHSKYEETWRLPRDLLRYTPHPPSANFASLNPLMASQSKSSQSVCLTICVSPNTESIKPTGSGGV